MPYSEKLKMIKEEKGLTNAVISKTGGVPLSTVTRVFSENSQGASFETYVGIARGMGISLDELAGLKQPDEQPLSSPIIETLSCYSELLKNKDDRIKELQEEKHAIRIEKYIFIGLLGVLLIAALTVIIMDISNGHFGYFRY